MHTLIMVPLQEEQVWFRQACTAHGLAPADAMVGRLVAMRVPELGLTVVPGGLGKVQFAVQTQHVLDVRRNWEWSSVPGRPGR
jgi:hypothetical protein